MMGGIRKGNTSHHGTSFLGGNNANKFYVLRCHLKRTTASSEEFYFERVKLRLVPVDLDNAITHLNVKHTCVLIKTCVSKISP